MKIVLQDKNKYILTISKGEEIGEQLKQFCKRENIDAGYFSIIGAVNELELWWYDPSKKEYKKKEFRQQMEITGIIGNVALLDGKIAIHMHGTFSGENYEVFGGHVNYAVVSGACEVIFEKLDGIIERKYDGETGLNLMECHV